jgi:hypothetical protein
MKKILLVLGFLFMSFSAFAQSGHSVTLNWTQSTTPGITTNNVYVSNTSITGPWSVLFKSASPIVTYTDTTQAGGTTVFYAVTALIGVEESAKSVGVSVTFPANPNAPTGVTVTNVQ